MRNKRYIIILGIVALILLIPLIAMQFTTEVNWSSGDFIIGGLLLLGISFLLEFAIRKIKTVKYRIVTCLVLLFIFILLWAELAVGIFGSPIAGS